MCKYNLQLKRAAGVFSLTLFCGFQLFGAVVTGIQRPHTGETVEVLVQYGTQPTEEQHRRVTDRNGRIRAAFQHVPVAHYDVTPEALADLEANPDVVSISPNQAVHSFIDRVTCSADYWPLYSYFTSIHRSYAAELGIAILDSGVNSANPNFHNPQSFRVCLLYDDGPTPRRIEPLLIFTDVEVPVGVEVAAQV